MARLPRVGALKSQVAMELRSHIAERVEHGQTVDDALRQLGDPVTLAESYLAAVPLVPATFWRRGVARILDFLAVVCLCAPIVWLLWQTAPFVVPPGFVFSIMIIVVVSLISAGGLYPLIAEYVWGETLGKHVMGLRVVRESGGRISFGQSVVRQLPMFLQVFWIDVMFALFTRKTSARLRGAVEDARRGCNGGRVMMKQTLMAPAFIGLVTLLSGQTPAAPSRPASMDDLVTEVRALRADIQHLADASIRAQLLVAPLQVQEQRIAGIARQLSETEEQIRALEGARNPFLTEMLKQFDKEPAEPGEVNPFAGMKAQLEKLENGDPVLKERQLTLSRQLSEEQARWIAFNAQLEELERLVTAPKRR